MAMTAFMKAGAIKGSGRQVGREGLVPVIGFTHEVTTEIDPGTGEVGQTRHHSAFVIQKEVDLSTPAFHQFQTNGAAIGTCTLELVHMPKSGPESVYFRIVLEKAKVVFVRTIMPPVYVAANSNIHEYEEIGLEYASITWEKVSVSNGYAGGAEGNSPSITDKVGAGIFFYGGVFVPDWLEAQAKIAVLKTAAELKAAGFDYGKNLYRSTLLKVQGKPPEEAPPEEK